MDKWSAIRFFISSAEQGSFAKAAQRYGSDPSTVSKAIKRLEDDLGFMLLQRSTRKLNLTEAGFQYLDVARASLEALGDAEVQLKEQNEQPKGVLRINLPVTYGRRYIIPLLEPFSRMYPDIKFEVHLNDSYVDIIDQRFDLTIRSGTVADSRLVARQISPMDFITFASPKLAKSLPKKLSPSQFHEFPWIRFRFKQSGKLMPILIQGKNSIEEVDPGSKFVVDDSEAISQLCSDSLGLTQLPHFAIKDELYKKSVVPLFPCCSPLYFGVYIIYPKRDYLPKKNALFIEYLVKAMEDQGENSRMTWARNLKTQYRW